MRDVLTAPFLRKTADIITEMYRQGWDERNGGNLSVLLDEEDVKDYVNPNKVIRRVPTGFSVPSLAGRYFLVTGTGKYFRNTAADPAENLGLLRIGGDGNTAELLWGLTDGGGFTSELPAHLMSHVSRLAADPEHRVVMHCHPNHLLAMTFVHPLEERELTRSLWRMCTECIMVFPEGVGVLPWMLCGTNEIGMATAEKMKETRLVLWAQHGIYGAGRSLDEVFGLIETAEKAAAIWLMLQGRPVLNTITDDGLRQIGEKFCGSYRRDYLDMGGTDI